MLTCEGPEGAQQLYCLWQATLRHMQNAVVHPHRMVVMSTVT